MPAPTPPNTRANTPDGPQQPKDWTLAMSEFVQAELRRGEDIKTVIILLETQYQAMRDKVSADWIREVGKGRW